MEEPVSFTEEEDGTPLPPPRGPVGGGIVQRIIYMDAAAVPNAEDGTVAPLMRATDSPVLSATAVTTEAAVQPLNWKVVAAVAVLILLAVWWMKRKK